MIKCPVCKTPNEDNYIQCRGCRRNTNPSRLNGPGSSSTSTEDTSRNKAEIFKNKGNEVFTKNDFQGAIQLYMKAIQYDPAHEGAWNNMGLAYRSTKDFRSAIKCFEKAISINPNNERALANKEACEYEVNRAILGLTSKEKEKPKFDPPRHTVSSETLARESRDDVRPFDQGRRESYGTAEPSNIQAQRSEITTVERETPVTTTSAQAVDSRTGYQYEETERSSNIKSVQNELDQSRENASGVRVNKRVEFENKERVPGAQSKVYVKDTMMQEDSRIQERDNSQIENSASYKSPRDETVQRNLPPPPEVQRESRLESRATRKEPSENKFIIEQKMGPLGLRPTTVIRTASENEFINEYRKQRKGRLGYSADRRNNISNNIEDNGEDELPAPPPDYEGPVGEATMKDLYDQGRKVRRKEESLCPYCRNPINSSNRNIRCFDCGSFFCATCEHDFRGTREKGQKAVCAKCYIKEIKEKERERKEIEREKNNIKKLEEQKRLREKLEEERRLRDKLEEEKRKIMDEMEVEKRRIRDKLEEERRQKEKLEEESRFREQLEREREKMREKLDKAKRDMEREYLLQHQLDEKKRKDNWLYRGLKDSNEGDDLNKDIGRLEISGKLGSLNEAKSKSLFEEPTMEMRGKLGSLNEAKSKSLYEEPTMEMSGKLGSLNEGESKSLNEEPTVETSFGEDESVFDVLARRFEIGEITSEEYERLIEEALEDE